MMVVSSGFPRVGHGLQLLPPLPRSHGLTFPPSAAATPPLSSSTTPILHGALQPIVVTGDPPTFVSAPGRRIVAIGDLHGDLDQAKRSLQLAGVLSSDGRHSWTGKHTVVVQLGDVLDRGENEIAILSLLRSLHEQAKAEGGAVFQVNGNHETMNVEGDYRYADAGAFEECACFLDYMGEYEYDWEEAFINWISVAEKWKEDHKMPQSYWDPWNLVKVVKLFYVNQDRMLLLI